MLSICGKLELLPQDIEAELKNFSETPIPTVTAKTITAPAVVEPLSTSSKFEVTKAPAAKDQKRQRVDRALASALQALPHRIAGALYFTPSTHSRRVTSLFIHDE